MSPKQTRIMRFIRQNGLIYWHEAEFILRDLNRGFPRKTALQVLSHMAERSMIRQKFRGSFAGAYVVKEKVK